MAWSSGLRAVDLSGWAGTCMLPCPSSWLNPIRFRTIPNYVHLQPFWFQRLEMYNGTIMLGWKASHRAGVVCSFRAEARA